MKYLVKNAAFLFSFLFFFSSSSFLDANNNLSDSSLTSPRKKGNSKKHHQKGKKIKKTSFSKPLENVPQEDVSDQKEVSSQSDQSPKKKR